MERMEDVMDTEHMRINNTKINVVVSDICVRTSTRLMVSTDILEKIMLIVYKSNG